LTKEDIGVIIKVEKREKEKICTKKKIKKIQKSIDRIKNLYYNKGRKKERK
jgi:hypothetical protein